MGHGANLAEDSLRVHATGMGLSVRAYRKILQKKYRERLAEVSSTQMRWSSLQF